MPEFTYVAQDANGKEKKGNVIADTPQMAVETVTAEGLVVLSVKEANALTRELNITIGRLVKPRDLSVFCRQFVSMLSSGVTVIAALDMLSGQTENKYMAKALREVQTDIMKGESLGNAMGRQKKIFPQIMVSMVKAGEASGKLEIAFERMSEHFEKAARTEGMVRKAAMYPIIVAIVSIVVSVFMLVKVVPSYMEMFDSMDMELPGITKAVIAMSDWLIAYWYIAIAVIVLIVIAIRMYKKTDNGKLFFGKLALKFPLIGKLNTKTACSLFARTLSTLVISGLPLVEAIEIVADTMSNEVYKRALKKTAEEVARGIPLSVSLKKSGIYPPMVDYMVEIGENTGELEEMLTKLADYYDEEVKMTTETVMAALEPMIILIMAALVGILIAAVMSPMISMYQQMGNM